MMRPVTGTCFFSNRTITVHITITVAVEESIAEDERVIHDQHMDETRPTRV